MRHWYYLWSLVDLERFRAVVRRGTMASRCIVTSLVIVISLQTNFKISDATSLPIEPPLIVAIQNDICTSSACNSSAKSILENMDINVDPCDNFYKFSCGGFINKTVIPDDKGGVDAFQIINDRIQKQLKEVFEKPSLLDEPRHIKLVKNYYESCMDEAAIEKLGLEPFKKILKELGGWPVLEGPEWNATNFDWIDLVRKFRRAGFSEHSFLTPQIFSDSKNITQKVLYLQSPQFFMSPNTLLKGRDYKDVKEYFNLMVDIAVIFGAPRDYAIAELRKSLTFELYLVETLTWIPDSHDQNLFYNPVTISELSEQYPGVAWERYINNILEPYTSVNSSEVVIINSPDFIEEFTNLMEITIKRAQANYAMWRVVTHAAYYLNKEVVQRLSAYSMSTTGRTKRTSRWMKCVDKVSKFIPANAMYVREHFSENARNKMTEMVTNILDQLEETLRTIDWMDNDTRKSALDKASTIIADVGYPNQLLNDTILDHFYSDLNLTADNFLENALAIKRFQTKKTYRTYREVFERNDWKRHPSTAEANAHYNRRDNSMYFPAGILQGVFFNESLPRYMNYGSIGAIIGHEATHAFDDTGRQYDDLGRLREWWSNSTFDEYHKRAECIVEQYSNYTVEEVGKKVSGYRTQGENIADNGGWKIAYLAYQRWSKTQAQEASLPGLKYNPRQMFWISSANVWCSKFRTGNILNRLINDPHSPTEFRILGSLRNLPEFAADFNCPIGSNMNPKDRCKFW